MPGVLHELVESVTDTYTVAAEHPRPGITRPSLWEVHAPGGRRWIRNPRGEAGKPGPGAANSRPLAPYWKAAASRARNLTRHMGSPLRRLGSPSVEGQGRRPLDGTARIDTAQQGWNQVPSCEHGETVGTKSGRTKWPVPWAVSRR